MDGGLLKRLALRTSQRLTPPRCQLYGRRPVAFDAFAGLALFRDVSSASRLNAVNAPQVLSGSPLGMSGQKTSRADGRMSIWPKITSISIHAHQSYAFVMLSNAAPSKGRESEILLF